MGVYVVNQGDTLWKIAQRYGLNVQQIRTLNQLPDADKLVVGQSLVIPDPTKEYVVQTGDTLAQIAKNYHVALADLAAVNNLTETSIIYEGQLLSLPYFLYLVEPGDSIWQLAHRFGVTTAEILQVNFLVQPSIIYPGTIIRIPFPAKPKKQVCAYTIQLDQQGKQDMLMNGRLLTYVNPFSYQVNSDGSLTSLPDERILEAAKEMNVAPLLVLSNIKAGEFDSDTAAAILRDVQLQDKVITNALTIMNDKGYRGININFEYVYPEDRDRYTEFLKRMVRRLHPQGYLVTTAVAPKTSSDQQGLLYEAHDYEAQGKVVDFINLMTYEWGWAGGRPLAIAPINEVEKVLDYAVTVIPKEKIMMGIPLYGRDWKIPWQEGTRARTINTQEAVDLAFTYKEAIQYDEIYQAPNFLYTDDNGQRHEVWFEDARSIKAKYERIANYDLRGAMFWVLGIPFAQNWPVLQNQFQVMKI
ncbi:LysM peptidoglycan-binding domain-containing protein [Virgibacillus dokdonensis]|uniref:Spore germination protein YaaH n=2 Tax=Virgibacillus dokdonensis TaxID=302167 RepID=A0A2K9IWC8_9BACI|nr:LysM peptidoglycan-binding domain-containing protein [Virgibacillus dokdonensis]AUJ23755.1 Spore germination protein YaaH [Virgibacillus dokdonensis]